VLLQLVSWQLAAAAAAAAANSSRKRRIAKYRDGLIYGIRTRILREQQPVSNIGNALRRSPGILSYIEIVSMFRQNVYFLQSDAQNIPPWRI
jgi:hypothetical protein